MKRYTVWHGALCREKSLNLLQGTSMMISLTWKHLELVWKLKKKCLESGSEVIKLFFMLNSAEHEIIPAHKC